MTQGQTGKRLLALLLFLALALLSGCADTLSNAVETLVSPDERYGKASPQDDYRVRDDKALYARGEDRVLTLYMTVGLGNAKEGTDHTWTEVNAHPLSYYEEQGIEPYACEAAVQFGDEIGPLAGEFGYGELTANATVRVRGTGSSERRQKSYRIDIKQGKGRWEEQEVIVLNKHVADPTRLRNRLAYALMAEIPEMFSARTWYVHLYVMDKTQETDGLFHDYGLYTAVEQINSRYFKNRGLDSSGSLYKAADFDWRPQDALNAAVVVGVEREAFERILEIKNGEDHAGLLEALRAVNDESIPIAQTVEKYFDADNLYSYLAFHILTGDRDAATGNYYLYSPQGENRWRFLSWDNDGMLSDTFERMKNEAYDPSWNHGIFMFAQSRLFERIFKDEACRAALDGAVEGMMDRCLTRENISEKAQALQALSQDLVYSLPDKLSQRVTRPVYERLIGALADEVQENYDAYKRSLSEPWPFAILDPEGTKNSLTLSWEPAYVYGGGTPVYSVELAQSPDFAQCIVNERAYEGTSYAQPKLPAGQYFLRVRAGCGGAWQNAKQAYITEDSAMICGTLCFYVFKDGSVEVLRYVEE